MRRGRRTPASKTTAIRTRPGDDWHGAGFIPADGVTASYSRMAGETVAGSPSTMSATLSPAGVLELHITNTGAAFTIVKRNGGVGDAGRQARPTGTGPYGRLAAGVSWRRQRDGGLRPHSRGDGARRPLYDQRHAEPGRRARTTTSPTRGRLHDHQRLAAWTTTAASKTYGDGGPCSGHDWRGASWRRQRDGGLRPGSGRDGGGRPGPHHGDAEPGGRARQLHVTNTGADFTINKRKATWTTNPRARPTATATRAGHDGERGGELPGGGRRDGDLRRVAGETVAGSPYHITATLSARRARSTTTRHQHRGGFTITKRTATWTTNPTSKTYGDADPGR